MRDGSLMELWYVDDLVLCGESLNDVMDKYKRWKNAVKGKGLRVNVDKTKGMQLSFGKKSSVSEVDPCGVCGERVGCNSIQCTKCQRWVHRRCSAVPRQVSLLSCRDILVCRTCLRHNCSVVEKLEFKTGEDVLEEVEKFCYLGDMISCFGEASEAVSARIGSAWKKFRELSGVLVGKQGLSLMQRGKIYQCCVRPVLLYCCETWELTVPDEMRLRGVERRMIRMIHDNGIKTEVIVVINKLLKFEEIEYLNHHVKVEMWPALYKFPALFSAVKFKLVHNFSQFIYRFKIGSFESWT